MITITVDNVRGLAVPEGLIEATVEHLITCLCNNIPIAAIGQVELIDGIRLAVRRGVLSDVQFSFNGTIYPIESTGKLKVWPAGFPGDVMNRQLIGLLSTHERK
jgi:hypothetical protein